MAQDGTVFLQSRRVRATIVARIGTPDSGDLALAQTMPLT